MKLQIKNLTKTFGAKEVLKNVNFTFKMGKIYGLLGRNGAGKTTFFNCVNNDIKADEGSFLIEENGTEREITFDDIGYVLSTPVVPGVFDRQRIFEIFLGYQQGQNQKGKGH